MKQTVIEPGLLSVFRIFTGLRLGFILLATIFHLTIQLDLLEPLKAHIFGLSVFLAIKDEPSSPYALLLFSDVFLLAVYLWWPPLQRRLGRIFLPVGLAMATVGPIMSQHFNVVRFYATEVFVLVGAWQLVVVLFLPLVLIGWQYNFHMALGFAVGTALLDAGLTILAIGHGNQAGIHSFLSIIFMRTVLYIVVGYMITRLITAQREQRQALARANTQLTHYATTLEQLSTSRERNRLARELHDTLAHTLSGVTVQLEAVRASLDSDPITAQTLLDQSLTTTRTGLTETRRALQALRASPLDDLGLALALRNLAESLATRINLTLDLRVPENLNDLNPAVEQCVYRVAQEALANVDRHANASHLTVQLDKGNQHLTLTIADDGRGFSLNEISTDHQFGLKGMKERAEMVGGNLEVSSRPGEGTTIRLIVPIVNKM